MYINKIFFAGDVTSVDGKGAITVATVVNKENDEEYIDIVIPGKEGFSVSVGDSIHVEGRIRTKTVHVMGDIKKNVTRIICEKIQWISKR
jgi:hypothetical protein